MCYNAGNLPRKLLWAVSFRLDSKKKFYGGSSLHSKLDFPENCENETIKLDVLITALNINNVFISFSVTHTFFKQKDIGVFAEMLSCNYKPF